VIFFSNVIRVIKRQDGHGMWYESERRKINRFLAVKSEKNKNLQELIVDKMIILKEI